MSESLPSEDAIRKQMEKLVPQVDTGTITIKQFIKMLSKQMGVNLKAKKQYIKEALTEVLDNVDKYKAAAEESEEEVMPVKRVKREAVKREAPAEESKEEEKPVKRKAGKRVKREAVKREAASDESEEEEKPAKRVKREAAKRETATKAAGKGKGGKAAGGLNAKKELSPELANFIGKAEESRPQIVKSLWVYFKENDLQNPDDKREILLDDALKAVFKVDTFTMFSLNKYIGAHVHPFKPVNLTEMSENSKKKKEDLKKRKAEQAKTGNKRKTGTQPAYHLSDDLANVVGKPILPRPQVTQALWVYIKENKLQVRGLV